MSLSDTKSHTDRAGLALSPSEQFVWEGCWICVLLLTYLSNIYNYIHACTLCHVVKVASSYFQVVWVSLVNPNACVYVGSQPTTGAQALPRRIRKNLGSCSKAESLKHAIPLLAGAARGGKLHSSVSKAWLGVAQNLCRGAWEAGAHRLKVYWHSQRRYFSLTPYA